MGHTDLGTHGAGWVRGAGIALILPAAEHGVGWAAKEELVSQGWSCWKPGSAEVPHMEQSPHASTTCVLDVRSVDLIPCVL